MRKKDTEMPMQSETRAGRRSLAFRDIRDMNLAWRSMLPLARHVRYGKGERVLLGEELLFLERGRIRLMFHGLEDADKIFWYIREGCIFGESAFFDPAAVDYYCLCMTACSIYAFSREHIDQISREHPDLLFNLMHSMSRKAKMAACQVSSLCQDSVLVRVCKFLSQRIVPDSNPLIATINIPQQEMASLLGVHRASLYRVLRRQTERGLFSPVTGDVITILRPREFYALAGM